MASHPSALHPPLTLAVVLLLPHFIPLIPHLGGSILAQNAPASTDSAAKDSAPHEHRWLGCSHCGPVLIVAAAVFAPPALLLVRGTSDPRAVRNGIAQDHVLISLTGGASWKRPGQESAWVHSVHLEALRGPVYGELSVQTFDFSDRGTAQFQTVRAGYLLRARSSLAGGVTMGYRHTTGEGAQNALEVGLPLAVDAPKGWIRLEPTYLLSSTGVAWNYRVQVGFPISRTPVVVGFNFEARTLSQSGPQINTAGLALGARF